MNLRWIVGAGAWLAFSAAVWFAGDMLVLGGYRPLEGVLERIVLIASTRVFAGTARATGVAGSAAGAGAAGAGAGAAGAGAAAAATVFAPCAAM